jgi:histidine ammonia-lyase
LGIELFYAAQAMDFHAPMKSGKILTAIYERVRSKIEPVTVDRIMTEDIEVAIEMIQCGELIGIAEEISSTHKVKWETPWSELFSY